MLVKDVLDKKDRKILSVEPQTTVWEAIRFMTKYDIGSVIVLNGGKLAGIFTERDLLHFASTDRDGVFDKTVGDVMSTQLTTMQPTDQVDDVLEVMLKKRIRHMPILDGNRLVGIISIGDAVKAKIAKTEEENKNLKNYIYSESGLI
ncbi:CBS domain-containing protein [Leptospira langatensis]|uniref:CBS domain-containing protein n=1 Tax=Leptospira langatensis TaxID=2484983 RepID=A0A5F1ZYN9_9LEPT|nr:CBS domain-containing protein [Leptospira langatensis]TGJ98636.1 CBS domain-containing protein [Leptospira langatensis]TGL43798.1 CBS domain-containing protein [Leptospira langatensis]